MADEALRLFRVEHGAVVGHAQDTNGRRGIATLEPGRDTHPRSVAQDTNGRRGIATEAITQP